MTPLGIAAVGALGGAAGAGLLTIVLVLADLGSRGDTTPVDRRGAVPLTSGTVLSETPGRPPDILQVAATFCQKVATGLFGVSLSPAVQRRLGAAWHVAYGASWGAGYAIVAASVPVMPLVLAVAFGLAVWAIGPGWLVPRMRLMLPPLIARRPILALVLAGHLAYAGVVAIVVAWLVGP